MSAARTLLSLAEGGIHNAHKEITTSGTLNVEQLSRQGITHYDHTGGAVTLEFPRLSDNAFSIVFLRNRGSGNITATDYSDLLTLTVEPGEGAMAFWIGGTDYPWGAIMLKATTVT